MKMMTNYHETLIEDERNTMKAEALKIAFEQAKLNVISMECLLDNSLNTVKYNKAWASLVANEVNVDAMELRNMNKRRKEKLELSQFSSSRQDDKSKFDYRVVKRPNNNPRKNTDNNPRKNRSIYNRVNGKEFDERSTSNNKPRKALTVKETSHRPRSNMFL